MKQDKTLTALTGALLAFAASWGALGCLTSALGLSLQYPLSPLLICGGASLLGAALLVIPHGAVVLLSLLALLAGYLYQDGRAARQLLALVHHLSCIYDRAYGWGVFLPQLSGDGFVDFPLGILGLGMALAVCASVCTGRSVWLPVLWVILPLCTCIVVTDTVPGEVWLLLVLFSLILLILTTSVRRENPAQGLRLTIGAALPVLLGLICLFLAVPKENYVNHSDPLRDNLIATAQSVPRRVERKMTELASRLQVQPPRQVDLAGLGERIALDYAVAEVTAEESGILYLREQDYDGYDGRGWRASTDRRETFPGTGEPPQTITIRCTTPKALGLLPYYPGEGVILTGGGVKEDAGEYTLLHSPLPEHWRKTAYGGGERTVEGLSRYLALPEETLQAGAALLGDLLPAKASNTEKADILAAFVTNSAQYDLNPSRMPPEEGDFALWFLREGEKGYCVHFATAAAVLLRAAGIPARYVTGYLVETRAGQTVTVTEENAHAWAEYFEPNLGLWLPLESTPAQQEEEIVVLPTEAETTVPTQTEETIPQTLPEETTQPVAQTLPERETAETLPEITQPPVLPEEETTIPVAVVFLPVLLLVPELQRRLRLHLRRRRQRTGDTNHQALLLWQEGVKLARLLKETPPEALEGLAQKAKFSQHQLTQEELAQLSGFCGSCIRRLGEKPWYLQWLYRYIYAVF